jgi:hypothetical protein
MRNRIIPFCLLNLVLIVWAVQLPAQSPETVEIATGLVKDLGIGPLLEKVFDKFLKDKTPKEAARPKVRELYVSLLEVKARREALLGVVEERIKVLGDHNADAETRALSRDDVVKSAADAKDAFLRLKNAFNQLNVDIDSSDPELSNAFGRFMMMQQPVYVIKTIDVDNLRALGVAQSHLQENRANLQDALKRLRALTQKTYPNFGELLSPGILR